MLASTALTPLALATVATTVSKQYKRRGWEIALH